MTHVIWTPDKIERIRQLAKAGYGLRHIQCELGVSLKALTGIMIRNQISLQNENPRVRTHHYKLHGIVGKRYAGGSDLSDIDELPDV